MTKSVNNAQLLSVAKEAALAAGKQVRTMFSEPRNVTSKGYRDVVTDADLVRHALDAARLQPPTASAKRGREGNR